MTKVQLKNQAIKNYFRTDLPEEVADKKFRDSLSKLELVMSETEFQSFLDYLLEKEGLI